VQRSEAQALLTSRRVSRAHHQMRIATAHASGATTSPR
jgi:hypothetical protein